MLSTKISDQSVLAHKVDAYIFFVEQDAGVSGALQDCAQQCMPQLAEIMTKQNFKGSAGSSLAVPIVHEGNVANIICVGLGEKNSNGVIDIETYRRAVGKAIKSVIGLKGSSAVCMIPSPELFGVAYEYLMQHTATIAKMAAYQYVDLITDSERKVQDVDVTFVVDAGHKDTAQKGVEAGNIIADAVNQARTWIDTPPSRLTPVQLADKASAIAKKHGFKLTVFDEQEAKKMGMGGLTGVSSGSDQDCKLVIMEYNCGNSNAPTLAFVGKGITFDSGGLSLKPPTAMETMKEDMSGAAAVISAMDVLGQLKPKVNIVAVTPLSENLPSGKATKPGDVLKFYNGKTAEVKNTDAEGRLILGDALSYAVKEYKLDAIIDIATLTGACAYALGPFFTGLMSQHDDFAGRVERAAQTSGDRVWRMPLSDDYKPAIKSEIADICNTLNRRYMAGHITAAHFLKNFVDDVPWVHLDIGGTAFDVPDLPYYRAGATGVGVRLLVDLAMNWSFDTPS